MLSSAHALSVVNILHNALTLYKRVVGSKQQCSPSQRWAGETRMRTQRHWWAGGTHIYTDTLLFSVPQNTRSIKHNTLTPFYQFYVDLWRPSSVMFYTPTWTIKVEGRRIFPSRLQWNFLSSLLKAMEEPNVGRLNSCGLSDNEGWPWIRSSHSVNCEEYRLMGCYSMQLESSDVSEESVAFISRAGKRQTKIGLQVQLPVCF